MNLIYFQPPAAWQKITVIDMHTGGEPVRIPIAGLPEITGRTILEKRRYFRDHWDHIRTGLMWEPRGHADMYGAIITPPVSDNAHFGTFFLHNEGYSTMCGHATLALAKFAVETGLVKINDQTSEIRIDAPPGLLRASVQMENGTVTQSSFLNVPSFLLMKNQQILVAEIGKIEFDIAYGGAFYAFVDADQLNLPLDAAHYNQLIDWGRKIKLAVMNEYPVCHPFEEDLSFLYGTIFTGKAHHPAHHSRNVCIFANGEVDRSATGSGVSARAALHHAKGELQIGDTIAIESILDTVMNVQIQQTTTYGPYQAVIPKVGGTAHFCGKSEFWFDPADPLKNGFIFR
jgi:trans-L-3-hydroxyproline dehydratase